MDAREFSVLQPAFTAARILEEKLLAEEHGAKHSRSELRTDALQVGALFLRAAQAIGMEDSRG